MNLRILLACAATSLLMTVPAWAEATETDAAKTDAAETEASESEAAETDAADDASDETDAADSASDETDASSEAGDAADSEEGDGAAGDQALATTDILDGIYSTEQAETGKEVFDEDCASCHAGNLRGTPGAPGLIGVRFDLRWEELTLGDMFTYLKENMPAGNPGSLTDTEYAQTMAHILNVQGYPANEDATLPADPEVLGEVEIVPVED